jgi:hypothetical protein
MVRRLFLPALLLLSCFAVAQKNTRAQKKKLPRFEDFPVEKKWNGVAAPVKLQSRADRMYRTNFRNAAREKPNFAGHYSVAMWGCGTVCLEGGIVDLATGELITLPYPRLKDRWEKWSFCQSAWRWSEDESDLGHDIETRPDSSLMILHCADVTKADEGMYPHTLYFVLDKGKFRKIEDRVGTERVN